MPRGSGKAYPRNIIRAHRRSYIDARTGRRRWQDHLLLEVTPLAVLGACLGSGVQLGQGASVGLLTVCGLLSAFLFGVMLQMADRAMTWADSSPAPGRETSAHAIYLGELAANAGYASLACVVAAVVFVVASVSSGVPLGVSS